MMDGQEYQSPNNARFTSEALNEPYTYQPQQPRQQIEKFEFNTGEDKNYKGILMCDRPISKSTAKREKQEMIITHG